MPRPDLNEVPAFYHRYVNFVKEEDVHTAIENNTNSAVSLLKNIPEEKWSYRYAEGKWSIKEMIQHVIDADRIFSYRALCFARGEKTSLPGFEENDYAEASDADRRTKDELITELVTLRQSIQQLFRSFSNKQLAGVGIANGNPVSVNSIGFIIPGHLENHLNVLKERYL